MGGPGWWGPPMWGFWWIFPLIGLTIALVFVITMMRAMSGRGGGFACVGGHGHRADDTDDLRREIRELREEIKQLRGGR